MDFNADGYIAPGFHDLDADALEEHFVTAFPASSTRAGIFSGFTKHVDEVSFLGPAFMEFLDGSFTSNKNDPGDIDLVGFADMYEVDALAPEQQAKLKALFAGPATKLTHSCDAYFLATVNENHPHFNMFRAQRKYWMGEFGYDREDRPKGIVRFAVSPK
jgi:hypothetical protein